MNINRKALKEACTDTFLALPINWFLSFSTLAIMIYFGISQAFLMSIVQVAVLTVFSVIRKYLIRIYYIKQDRNV
tara:strand:- start:402 stop:626 length:225 start_codon:yes stop_codon:yes gene_type:complete